ncbi:hypothetical protein FA95DRAFT_1568128, partial [Auriscalpium vulgare]
MSGSPSHTPPNQSGESERDVGLRASGNAKRELSPGQIDVNDMKKWMLNNLFDTGVQELQVLEKDPTWKDIKTFDFKSLTNIVPYSAWIVTLNYKYMLDANFMKTSQEMAAKTPGSQHYFLLTCAEVWGPTGRVQRTRFLKPVFGQGPPDAAELLYFIKRSFVHVTPALPNFLVFSNNLAQQISELRPFLDALPMPFSYDIEPAMAAFSQEVLGRQDQHHVALAAPDCGATRLARLKSLSSSSAAMMDKRDKTHHTDVKKRSAARYANLAAVRLRAGGERNAELALSHGRQAEEADPTYSTA